MSRKDSKKSMLLWVDLEMTGLSPVHDRILEVAAIITDWDLEEKATYTGVVKVSDKIIAERMVGEFWEKNKASYDGLVAQNASGKPATTIEKELLDFVNEHCGDAVVYLAGNSIHQDQKFIEREWPELNERLHYRQLDVSSWKVYFENALGQKFMKPDNHRALDDIRGSIEELKWYLKKLS
ncbi:MAG: oligoribonuclease [Candidatus Saccharibacteria bacterium]|nr:oligoribonuclease [Candidatus Saccharibacteria bacterium]